eukprot:403361687
MKDQQARNDLELVDDQEKNKEIIQSVKSTKNKKTSKEEVKVHNILLSDDQIKNLYQYLRKTVLYIDLSNFYKDYENLDHNIHKNNDKTLKIAGLDLDSTLIKAKDEKNILIEDDWVIMYKTVPDKLRELYNQGFKLVLFTQQIAFSKGLNDAFSFTRKMIKIQQQIQVPLEVYVSTSLDYYRKPSLSFWKVFEEQEQQKGNLIDLGSSFFVGDCAGRAADPRDTDLKFAINIGIKFFTPEEMFVPNFQKDAHKIGKKAQIPDFTNYQKAIEIFKGQASIDQDEIKQILEYLEEFKDSKSIVILSQTQPLQIYLLELNQMSSKQFGTKEARRAIVKLFASLGYKILMIELFPFDNDKQQQIQICQHFDMFKKFNRNYEEQEEEKINDKVTNKFLQYENEFKNCFLSYQNVADKELKEIYDCVQDANQVKYFCIKASIRIELQSKELEMMCYNLI